MPYSQNIDACLSGTVGPAGLDGSDFDALLQATTPTLERLKAHHRENTLPLLRLPERGDDIAAMEPVAERFQESFDDVVVLGTGGSSSGIGTSANFWTASVGTETSGSILSPSNQTMSSTVVV